MIKIKRGLDLPIAGAPVQEISGSPEVSVCALLGPDYVGMKPTMQVRIGDKVQKGQPVFLDKKTEGVVYTAPISGEVVAINRGEKRVFESVVISRDDSLGEITWEPVSDQTLMASSQQEVMQPIVESGLLTAFRKRPFSKVPSPTESPNAIFVTAIDTHPLSADPNQIIDGEQAAFDTGLKALSRLTDGKVFLAVDKACEFDSDVAVKSVFDGPHPAGLPGTHIHFLNPVNENKSVWHIGYQDVIAIGKLFSTGKLDTDRVVAIGGPLALNPRLIKVPVGADLGQVTSGELGTGEARVISGSVFGGRTASGTLGFLGRHHVQISCLEEGRDRPMLHYLRPGFDRFSIMGIYISKLFGKSSMPFTTSTNGSERAMVPVGTYERVMPLDILPTQLLRSLVVGDIEMAVQLGALELDEEDLALCTFSCPGKYEFGPILRDNLTRIELEA